MNVEKLNTSEVLEIKELVDKLCTDDGVKRKETREKLISKGAVVMAYVKDLYYHPKHHCRWEAMKVMEEIADPAAIPLFLEALEDEESDIRWIAAEGLIHTGKLTIQPLLNLLLNKSNSVFVLNGAHHIFSKFKKRDILPDGFPANELLNHLKHFDNESNLKVVVYKSLDNLRATS